MNDKINQNSDEIFIVDEEIVNNFFMDKNFEKAQMFFDYLTVQCKTKKAYMIPSIFERVIKKIKEKTKDKGDTIQTEIISYLENWVEEADLLGEDQGDEKHDTLLLYRILRVLNSDKKIVILSSKYQNESVDSLSVEDIESYLLSKEKFREYLKSHYGLDDGASY